MVEFVGNIKSIPNKNKQYARRPALFYNFVFHDTIKAAVQRYVNIVFSLRIVILALYAVCADQGYVIYHTVLCHIVSCHVYVMLHQIMS